METQRYYPDEAGRGDDKVQGSDVEFLSWLDKGLIRTAKYEGLAPARGVGFPLSPANNNCYYYYYYYYYIIQTWYVSTYVCMCVCTCQPRHGHARTVQVEKQKKKFRQQPRSRYIREPVKSAGSVEFNPSSLRAQRMPLAPAANYV
jgi:hypothetical protein